VPLSFTVLRTALALCPSPLRGRHAPTRACRRTCDYQLLVS